MKMVPTSCFVSRGRMRLFNPPPRFFRKAPSCSWWMEWHCIGLRFHPMGEPTTRSPSCASHTFHPGRSFGSFVGFQSF